MSTARHWRKSNFPSAQKKPSYRRKDRVRSYLTAMILASLIGTYLDLLFVGAGMYSFPKRFMPAVFPIHILFTLCILPLCSFIFLFISRRLLLFHRSLFLLICSLFAYIAEQTAERLGLFIHSQDWKHEFTLVGYLFFLIVIWKFYHWMEIRQTESGD